MTSSGWKCEFISLLVYVLACMYVSVRAYVHVCVCVSWLAGGEGCCCVWTEHFVFPSLHAQLDSQMGLMVGSMQSDGVSGTRDEV